MDAAYAKLTAEEKAAIKDAGAPSDIAGMITAEETAEAGKYATAPTYTAVTGSTWDGTNKVLTVPAGKTVTAGDIDDYLTIDAGTGQTSTVVVSGDKITVTTKKDDNSKLPHVDELTWKATPVTITLGFGTVTSANFKLSMKSSEEGTFTLSNTNLAAVTLDNGGNKPFNITTSANSVTVSYKWADDNSVATSVTADDAGRTLIVTAEAKTADTLPLTAGTKSWSFTVELGTI